MMTLETLSYWSLTGRTGRTHWEWWSVNMVALVWPPQAIRQLTLVTYQITGPYCISLQTSSSESMSSKAPARLRPMKSIMVYEGFAVGKPFELTRTSVVHGHGCNASVPHKGKHVSKPCSTPLTLPRVTQGWLNSNATVVWRFVFTATVDLVSLLGSTCVLVLQ